MIGIAGKWTNSQSECIYVQNFTIFGYDPKRNSTNNHKAQEAVSGDKPDRSKAEWENHTLKILI